MNRLSKKNLRKKYLSKVRNRIELEINLNKSKDGGVVVWDERIEILKRLQKYVESVNFKVFYSIHIDRQWPFPPFEYGLKDNMSTLDKNVLLSRDIALLELLK